MPRKKAVPPILVMVDAHTQTLVYFAVAEIARASFDDVRAGRVELPKPSACEYQAQRVRTQKR